MTEINNYVWNEVVLNSYFLHCYRHFVDDGDVKFKDDKTSSHVEERSNHDLSIYQAQKCVPQFQKKKYSKINIGHLIQ